MLQAETIGDMSLPATNSLDDCVDFTKTVTPYLSQLYDLPKQILQSITNSQGLKVLYISTNPFISGLALALFLGPVFIVAAEVNRNYSQVDRFWGILPTVFIANFCLYAHAVGLPTERLDLLLAVSTLWSTRLTYNYWRRGGYNIGSEDYRWKIVQKQTGKLAFHLFNATFIGPYQCLLLYSITLPAYVMLLYTKQTGDSLNTIDIIMASVMVGFIALLYVADQQQWDYQTAKYKYRETAKVPPNSKHTPAEFDRGFNTSGLWAYSRHPNFAAEQSVWLSLYWWVCNLTADGGFYNWTGIGIAMYLALFQGSTWLTEMITSSKHPEYKEYQKQVGMFLPWGGSAYTPKVTETLQKKSE